MMYKHHFYVIELCIKTLTGSTLDLLVSPFDTIYDVKFRIQKLEGIPASQQHLIWQSEELEDDRTLREYHIYSGATLQLVLSMRGGPVNTRRVVTDEPTLHEMAEYLAESQDDVFPSDQQLYIVYHNGDHLNFFRVVDRDTSSSLSYTLSGASDYNPSDESPSPKERREENDRTREKMQNLRSQMLNLSLSKDSKDAAHKPKTQPADDSTKSLPVPPQNVSATSASISKILRGHARTPSLQEKSQLDNVGAILPQARPPSSHFRPPSSQSGPLLSQAARPPSGHTGPTGSHPGPAVIGSNRPPSGHNRPLSSSRYKLSRLTSASHDGSISVLNKNVLLPPIGMLTPRAGGGDCHGSARSLARSLDPSVVRLDGCATSSSTPAAPPTGSAAKPVARVTPTVASVTTTTTTAAAAATMLPSASAHRSSLGDGGLACILQTASPVAAAISDTPTSKQSTTSASSPASMPSTKLAVSWSLPLTSSQLPNNNTSKPTPDHPESSAVQHKPSTSQTKPPLSSAGPASTQTKPTAGHSKLNVSKADSSSSKTKLTVNQTETSAFKTELRKSQAKPNVDTADPCSQAELPASQPKPTVSPPRRTSQLVSQPGALEQSSQTITPAMYRLPPSPSTPLKHTSHTSASEAVSLDATKAAASHVVGPSTSDQSEVFSCDLLPVKVVAPGNRLAVSDAACQCDVTDPPAADDTVLPNTITNAVLPTMASMLPSVSTQPPAIMRSGIAGKPVLDFSPRSQPEIPSALGFSPNPPGRRSGSKSSIKLKSLNLSEVRAMSGMLNSIVNNRTGFLPTEHSGDTIDKTRLPSARNSARNSVRKMSAGRRSSSRVGSASFHIPSVKLSAVHKKSTKRCSFCAKKTRLAMSFQCRCGNNYCSIHRYAEAHNCTFDYKTEGRKLLEQSNPVVAAPKLPKI